LFARCQAKKKGFNLTYQLRLHSSKYRDDETPLTGYKVAALFSEFAPEWHKQISAESWSQMLNRFKRGGLDTELLEKVSLERSVTASSFRFVAAYGADADPSVFLSTDEVLDAQQKAAVPKREEACFDEIKVKILKEQNKFIRHKQEVEKHACVTESARMAFKVEEKQRNDEVLQKHLDKVYPVRDMEHANGLIPYVKSSVNEWLEQTDVDQKGTMFVYFCNLMVPGNKYLRSANIAISKIADCVAASPERTCGIILGPNAGAYGETYADDSIHAGMKELEELLGDESFRIRFKKLTFSFSEDSLAAQSQRACWHPGVMIISDQHVKGDNASLISFFAKCKMWIRAGAQNLQANAVSEYVNPLAKIAKANFDPTKDLSRNHRNKQWMGGSKLQQQLRCRVWNGMKVTSATPACWVDLFPFDGSLPESIMRSASDGPERARMPMEMVVSTVWAPMDTDRTLQQTNDSVASHIKSTLHNVLSDLLEKKLYLVEGWSIAPPRDEADAPRLQASAFKCTCPTQDGSLAFRDDWLEAVSLKLGKPDSHSWKQMTEFIAKHNVAFNSMGGNFKDPATGTKRRAEEPAEDRRAEAVEKILFAHQTPNLKPI